MEMSTILRTKWNVTLKLLWEAQIMVWLHVCVANSALAFFILLLCLDLHFHEEHYHSPSHPMQKPGVPRDPSFLRYSLSWVLCMLSHCQACTVLAWCWLNQFTLYNLIMKCLLWETCYDIPVIGDKQKFWWFLNHFPEIPFVLYALV